MQTSCFLRMHIPTSIEESMTMLPGLQSTSARPPPIDISLSMTNLLLPAPLPCFSFILMPLRWDFLVRELCEYSPRNVHIGQGLQILEIGPDENGTFSQLDVFQPGALEIGETKVGARQIQVAQCGIPKLCVAEIDAF